MTPFSEHPLRAVLTAEMHSRPHAVIEGPAEISFLASLTGEEVASADIEHIRELCTAFKIAAPAADASQFEADFGPFRLKWERHTEFSTYMLTKAGRFENPFKEPAVLELPADWVANIPGDIISAFHIAVETEDSPERDIDALTACFDNNTPVGGTVLDGGASLWADYQEHADGFMRFLIRAGSLRPPSLGRLVQRVAEMETYRMMAMLALPPARDARPEVAALEQQLSGILQEVAANANASDEPALLKRLSAVAAETERISASLNFRFSASRAYQEIVRQRAAALRLERISGLQPLTDYVFARFNPAMETGDNLMRRIETLSRRIARASDLLRTRVNVALEAQNRDLLQSMDRRAKLQLRLQQTVEGLSVVAISYYLVGLIQYLLKGLKSAGVMPYDPDKVTLVVIPILVIAIWLGVRRIRHAIERDAAKKR